MERINLNLVNQALTPTTPQFSVGNPDVFKSIVTNSCERFDVDEFNIDILNDMYSYVSGKGNLDPNKGIWFWGDIGTGKSTLLKILAEYQRCYGKGFKIVNCSTLSINYSSNGDSALIESTNNEFMGNTCPVERGFDELGREPRPSKYFGAELDVMQFILASRYNFKAKTHITTNIKYEGISNFYGNYILDRAIEMFNFIEVKGKSRRK